MRMQKRIYGIIGISSIMANWNADFSGNPKSLSTGEIFGSDKALKYTIKKKWQSEGEKILYIKSYELEKATLRPRSLEERYNMLFNTSLKKGKDQGIVVKNLFSATDVKNFGATFAETSNNISILGAVQIGQGMNKYEDTRVHEQQILSPFRDSTKDDAKSSTLGTKIVSEEAHYFYSFSINPKAYLDYEELGFTDGYTEEDYIKFKEASMVCATNFSSNSKVGADNEFNMFIETDEETYLPNLANYILFNKTEDKNIIEFSSDNFLDKIQGINNIEIYYNPNTTKLVGFPDKANFYNILTQEEV